ncbi:glycoside hydrolase family 1 protein [Jeotgalibacillus haloalkalitolerans]|uniref:Glycoside hydrolase family 1 protein n=1 Tax=Jeotgalibacillus haloalkalitolerans TaxID=3104292 RepID=A0ABU5KKE7_9BACL|nr:glycoside hydrolase family 1 protein [Jeotgalibacillus sp. HH7-29]MDZ5711416.1 glycoside hydrolase family 1 protein [Jeotgalibacillus sp. HH7-29]
MERRFPDGFWWGAASSAPQSEGALAEDGKAQTVWDAWFEREADRFFDHRGPVDAEGFFYRMKEDVALMKDCGLNSFRTSISWARLLPDGVHVSRKAVLFYREMLLELKQQGIEPVVNLYHFDLPLHLYEQGGWENRKTVEAFSFYANTVFEQLGDLADYWTTFNEPIVPVEMGYLNHYHLPAVYEPARACQAGYHTMIAHAEAVRVFRKVIPHGKIGMILNLMPNYPRTESPEDQEAAFYADLIFNRSFLDPSVKGVIPQELKELLKKEQISVDIQSGDDELIRQGKVDFLGVNYYQPRRVQEGDASADKLTDRYFLPYSWPGARINPHRGWEIYERGLYDISIRIRDEYCNIPWYVAENGMGVEGEKPDSKNRINDQYRIWFYEDHLAMLHKGIGEGSNCFGYHVWTFIDNWSWLNAYKNRYGLVHLDLESGRRIKKESAEWFKSLSASNVLTGGKHNDVSARR